MSDSPENVIRADIEAAEMGPERRKRMNAALAELTAEFIAEHAPPETRGSEGSKR